jgi:lysylphosphatidylglycerol synthetase-like protein (DUF2156 family)
MSHVARQRTALSGVLVLILDAAIWLIPRDSSFEPPQPFVLRIGVPLLLATPGLLALIAAATARPAVATAAGVLCLPQAVIAFSGVTLVFLIPALMILLSAGARDDQPEQRSRVHPARLLLAVILAIPIVYVVVATLGVLAPLLLVLIAGVVGLARHDSPPGRGRRSRVSLREGATGAAIVVLVVAAWVVTLGLTETVCWVARQDASGGITWQQVPPTNQLTIGAGEVGESCASGQPTAIAVGLTTLLLSAALLRAALPLKSHPPVPA